MHPRRINEKKPIYISAEAIRNKGIITVQRRFRLALEIRKRCVGSEQMISSAGEGIREQKC